MSSWLLTLDATGSVPKRELKIDSLNQLNMGLQKLANSKEGSATLCGSGKTGDFLVLGVEGDLAFSQFIPMDPVDTPPEKCRPYQWALASESHDDEPDLEFSLGGTPTDVTRRRCITVEKMMEIAKHYFETQELLKGVTWEAE